MFPLKGIIISHPARTIGVFFVASIIFFFLSSGSGPIIDDFISKIVVKNDEQYMLQQEEQRKSLEKMDFQRSSSNHFSSMSISSSTSNTKVKTTTGIVQEQYKRVREMQPKQQQQGERKLKNYASFIRPRIQWDCNFNAESCCKQSCNSANCDGYCGSVSLQESLLFYGGYASQGLIRRLVITNDVDSGAREILIATPNPTKRPSLTKTAQLLGLGTENWFAKQSGSYGLSKFYKWSKNSINRKAAPVVMGVIFSDSWNSNSYDHIVTAVGVVKGGLKISDHYESYNFNMFLNSMPNAGDKCREANNYCFSRNMYAVAILKPPALLDKSRIVRLFVVDNTSGQNNKEPNWTCNNWSSSTLTLKAKTAYPNLLDASKTWYVAKINHVSNASEIRNTFQNEGQGPFAGNPLECYLLDSSSLSTSSVTVTVGSNEAIFFRIVGENEGCVT